jgi:hypothetical protein
MGRTAFDMQMMLRIEQSEEIYPLSFSDLLITNFPPTKVLEYIYLDENKKSDIYIAGKRVDDEVNCFFDIGKLTKPNYTIMSVDPSGRGEDLFAYSIISVYMGKMFIHKVNGLQGGYKDDNLFTLIDACKLFRVNKVVIEDNFGDGAITQLLLKAMDSIGYRVNVEEVKNLAGKTDRMIDTLEPLFNQHRVIFDRHVIEDSNRISNLYGVEHSLAYQLSRLVRDEPLAHDDCLDSLELGLGWVVRIGGGLSVSQKFVSMDGGVR